MFAVAAVAAVAAIAVMVGLYAAWLGARLDRLDMRVEAASASLDAQLLRRAAAAERLAADTADTDAAGSDALATAARAALAAEGPARESAESALSRALRAVVEQVGPERAAESAAAATRVQLARQFRNDAVHANRALRGRIAVRALRLAVRRPLPPYFEIDDVLG